ncbi:sensor histidine kinase [Microbispora siamensis]
MPATDDEIQGMAESVNHTLSRLDTALQQAQNALQHQRQFVSNASHDLRQRGEQHRLDLAEVVAAELRNRRHPTKRVESALQSGVLVLGDRVGLARLLTNLLDNAERHARTTITVSVRHEPGGGYGDRYPQGAAVMEVADDGPGIERDKRETVFDRFTRLDTARSRDAGGAGLGLPIARQIAESHGGTLRIEDSPVGARFVLDLPCAPAAHLTSDARPR